MDEDFMSKYCQLIIGQLNWV